MNELKNSGTKEIPVTFGNQGIKLQGLIRLPAGASASNPVPGALLCHGFGADNKVMESSALLMVKKGVATMVFDLRGHGSSGGYLDGNSHEDIIDAWHELTARPEVDKSRIALIGHSLGAISSIIATRKIMKPKAIVALSCPADIDKEMRAVPVTLWFITQLGRIICRVFNLKVRMNWDHFLGSFTRMKLSSALAGLDDCSKLFVFSSEDPLSSFKNFTDLYEKAPGPKQKMLTRGSHVTPLQSEIIRFEWIGWVIAALRVKKLAVETVRL
jgi:fermentation-respiration switch protein FrsA (DUF1100 family)